MKLSDILILNPVFQDRSWVLRKKITLLPFLRNDKTNIQTNLKITSLDKNDNHFFSSEMMIPSQEKDSMFITNIILIVKHFDKILGD